MSTHTNPEAWQKEMETIGDTAFEMKISTHDAFLIMRTLLLATAHPRFGRTPSAEYVRNLVRTMQAEVPWPPQCAMSLAEAWATQPPSPEPPKLGIAGN